MTDKRRRNTRRKRFRSIGSAHEVKPLHDRMWLLPAGMAPAVLALTFGLVGTAAADIEAVPPRPAFTASDLAMIARNASLTEAAAHNPWVVYRVLRLINANTPRSGSPRAAAFSTQQPKGPADTFDYKRDPDLKNLQRVAPEAAHDLFLLIKKAAKPK